MRREQPVVTRHASEGEALLQRAMAALDRGDIATAAAEAQLAADLDPSSARAWGILSLALHRGGALDQAIFAGRKATELDPRAASYHANLGVVLRAAHRLPEAEAAYRAALAADPRFAPAHNNLANLARDRARYDEAAACYRAALAIDPSYADAWHGLGIVLQRQEKLADAAETLEKAVSLRPQRADAMSDLAAIYMGQQRFTEAAALLAKAIEADPNSATAHGNLGALQLRHGHMVAAYRETARAMALAPGEQRWVSNLGVIAKDLSRYVESEALFRRALALKPDYALAHANLLFCLNYHPDRSPEEIFAEYARFDAAHARPHLPASVVHDNDPTPGRRLRVGFLSPDFREHAARFFLDPLLRHLDRTRLEIVCYAEVTNEDAVTRTFKTLADHWRSSVGLSDETLAARIREDKIDILVDFGGHTSASRLLVMARKPAPIQVAHHLGHGYTSGLSAVDVFLSDQEMAPVGSEALFAERQIVRLSRIPVAYHAPEGMPEVASLPALRNGFITFGYFGRPERINDRVVAAWSEILRRVPSSRLMLNAKAFSEGAFADLMAGRFAAHGIGRDRLHMVYTSPQSRTWSAYGEVDIALDPFPHNAGTTTIEALYLGVPVVSVEDRPSVGRFGASNLGAVGLRDWVAKDVAGYVALAAEKASDIAALAALRSGLRARFEASPLADGPGLAREIEAAFNRLWKEWCAGARAASPAVSPQVAEGRRAALAGAQELDRKKLLVQAADVLLRHWRSDPADAEGALYLSDIYRRLGRLPEAEGAARAALKAEPKSAAASNALGNALAAQQRLTEALAAFTDAISVAPGHAEALNNRALVLMRRGQLCAAERDLRRAQEVRPGRAEIGFNLANALQDQGRIVEAIEAFEAALAKAPTNATGHGMMLFAVTYHPGLDGEQIYGEFLRWNALHAEGHAPRNPVWTNDRTTRRRLRIGYVSPDFAAKSSRHFIEPILVGHDRRKVEVFCYAEVPRPDGETERLKALAENWRSTVGLSDDQLADLIRRDAIDVLVDLGGHTARNRLLTFARKPAPVQVAHFLGHGYTSGLATMDAFLADDELAPEGADAFFSEPVERLARMPVAYQPPEGMPEVAPLPALRNGYVTFGHFGRVVRLNDEVVATWSEILKAVPNARLVLNTVAFLDEEVCRRFRALFARHGISAERLDLVFSTPQSKTWEAYGAIDIALDPFPHNGGTTTIEAAWLGVPSVCLKARPSVGRFGAAIMRALGLSDWVAATKEEYVAKTVARAEDISALAELRAGLRQRMAESPLCDAKGLGAELERVYQRLWLGYVDREDSIETLQKTAAWAYQRGNAARAVELFQEAAKRCRRPGILSNLGAALRAAGRLEEAEAAYREAIARAPDFPNAHGNLGNLLAARGRQAEAEAALRRAHALAPNDPQVLRSLGLCLMRQLKATEAEAMLRKAAALLPDDSDIHDNLAQLLRQKGEPVAASEIYARLGDRMAHNWRAIGNRALLLQDLSRYVESEALFRRALALKPDYALAHANLLFCLNYHPDRSPEEIFAEYARFDAVHARPHLPASVVHDNDPTPGRRLRVGFLSPDFREHAARFFLDPLLRHLDRTRLEIVCYAEVTNEDAVTRTFKSLADHWRSSVGLSDEALAARIREDKIDILVDFGGHTSASRLLVMARKPAPIQVAHHLGHGYTSGLSAVDVFLSDQEMAPVGSEALFAERQIVRLSRIPVAYHAPEGMPEVAPLPALRNGFITFGYFGRPERINDRVVAAWSEILRRVPSSHLMLNAKAFSEGAFADLMAGRFAAHGIGRDRLHMVYTSPQSRTWSAYGEVDIALDPFPHNAGTTTIEALYLGVPVVSVEDRPSVGRFGASNLGAVGLRDWVAKDVAGYVTLAAEKASDVVALAALRSGLRARFEASPLADGTGLAREIEAAFHRLWKEWCSSRRRTDEAVVQATVDEAIQAFQSGDTARAFQLADRALAASPDAIEARHLRGVAAYRLGRLPDAVSDLLEAIRHAPERADLRWNVTPMLRGLGRLREAEAQGKEAVRLAPRSPEAHNNLATVYKDLGRAGEAEAHLRRALALKPDYSDAWSNLSWTLSLAGNAREAESTARRAFALNPRDANALNNIGTALMQQDRLAEAADCFAGAVRLKPDFSIAHSNYLFCLNYRTDLTPEEIFEAYRDWDRAHAAPLRPAAPVHFGSRDPERRLRIGYVSPDFRYHAVSFFIESLIAAHDPSRFEVTCYAEVANPDDVTERFKHHAQRWRSTVGLSDAELADMIRGDEIDILIDLAGHTAGNRLLAFARKAAPVQVAHMVGSGTTTGLSAIDAYLINEALLPQGAERYFSERPLRLSRMPHVYVPPEGMPEVAPLPALRNGFITFGCFSRPARINEEVIRTWTRILRSVPDSRLVLNSKPFREEENCAIWQGRFAESGIEPGRVKLVYTSPQPRTWDAYGTIDIALDPFPHNAGTTTIEALWLGVPVVSLASRPPVGRFGASILGSVGLDDWVARDVDAYVARAVTAASNIDALSRLRASLRARFAASPIGSDAAGLAREIEAQYRDLWRAYCANPKA